MSDFFILCISVLLIAVNTTLGIDNIKKQETLLGVFELTSSAFLVFTMMIWLSDHLK